MNKMSPKQKKHIDDNVDPVEPIKTPEIRYLALYISFWGLVFHILINAYYDRNIEKEQEYKYDGVYKISDDYHDSQ